MGIAWSSSHCLWFSLTQPCISASLQLVLSSPLCTPASSLVVSAPATSALACTEVDSDPHSPYTLWAQVLTNNSLSLSLFHFQVSRERDLMAHLCSGNCSRPNNCMTGKGREQLQATVMTALANLLSLGWEQLPVQEDLGGARNPNLVWLQLLGWDFPEPFYFL